LFPYKVGQRLHLQSLKSPINHAPEADPDYMPILLLMRNPLVPAVYLKNKCRMFVLDGLAETGIKVPAVDGLAETGTKAPAVGPLPENGIKVPAVDGLTENGIKVPAVDGLTENGIKVLAVDDLILQETLLADLGNKLRETWKSLPLLSTVIFKRRFSRQKMSS
jgi:hypothetical protein